MGWLIFIAFLAYVAYSSSKKGSISRPAVKPVYNSYANRKPYSPPIVNKKLNEDQIYIEKIKLSD